MLDNPVDSKELPEPPRPVVSSRLILWLVVLSLGLLFLPLYMISTSIKENNLPLMTQLAVIQATLTVTPPPDPMEESLKSTLVAVQKQINALEALQPTLIAGHTDWPAAMAIIANYDSTQMSVTGVAQAGSQIIVTGQAGEESAVMAYADTLRTSNQFGRVVLQSITSKTLPTATPAAATAAAATLVATAVSPGFHPGNKVVEFTIALERKVNAR